MIAINDPAGTAIAFTKAINRYTEHSCRLVTKAVRYNFMFEKDLHLPWLAQEGWDEVEELLRISDVFHFHMTADESIALGPLRPANYLQGKLIVHHHHGHPDFRANPEKYRRKYKERGRRNLLVSTPDLLKLLPEAKWQPNLVPIQDPLYTPLENKPDIPVVICHSPTRKDLKNTAEFLHATGELKRRSNISIERRLIENTPHRECLRLKRASHILFDHLQGYYGVSSLEGLSQGLCVIAGLDEWNRQHILEFIGARELPWITPSAQGLWRSMETLVQNPQLLSAQNRQSRRFMEVHWSDERISRQLVQSYQ